MKQVLLVLSSILTLVSAFERSLPMFIVGVVGLMLYIVATCIERNDEEQEAQAMLRACLKDMPMPRKRFTYIRKNRVEINEEDLGELLMYMAELEDYLQEVGKL